MTQDIELAYRLPVTALTIAGKRTTTQNPHSTPQQSVTRTSSILCQIQADWDRLWVIQFPRVSKSTSSFSIERAPDFRLTKVEAAVDDKR